MNSIVFEDAEKLILRSFLTDLLFIYTPAQIALGCLCFAANRRSCGDAVQDYIKTTSPTHFQFLKQAVDDINQVFQSTTADIEEYLSVSSAKIEQLLRRTSQMEIE